MSAKNRAYHLKLADGEEWQIVSTDETEPLVDRLASILELKPHNGEVCPRLIVRMFQAKEYSARDVGGRDGFFERENLPEDGWRLSHPYYVQYLSHPDVPDVICEVKLEPGLHSRGIAPPQDIVSGRWIFFPIIQRVLESGGLTFHAGLAEWNGLGVLFAGPSNIGKSTTCSRLPSPWRILGDDEALIVRNESGRFVAHPMPTWSTYFRGEPERSWDIQQHVPLSAICYLERAERDEISRIGVGKAALLINDSARQIYGACQWVSGEEAQVGFRKVVFNNAAEVARKVPAFSLRLSLTGRFWEEIERSLSEIEVARKRTGHG